MHGINNVTVIGARLCTALLSC